MKSKRSLEEACKVSINYNLADDLHDKSLVDAMDMQDNKNWRMAEIKSVREDTVSIHYEAWSPTCDVPNLPKNSPFLAPFRSHTVGYTGQKRQPLRDFKFSKDTHDNFTKVLRRLMDTNFETEFSALELTEFMRGRLFVYTDSLLSMMNVFTPTLAEVHDIFAFFDLVVEFTLKWINEFPKFKEEYEASKKYPRLYLVDTPTAVSLCYPELAFTLKTCFGGDKLRTHASFMYADKVMRGEEHTEETSMEWAVELAYNMFKRHGGFEVLLNTLTMVHEKTCEYIYPVRMIYNFLESIRHLIEYYKKDPNFKEKFVNPLSKAIIGRFMENRKSDLEELDIIGLKAFFNLVDEFLAMEGTPSIQLKQNLQHYICLYYLECEDPRTRVKGIDMLKDRLQISQLFINKRALSYSDILVKTVKTIADFNLLEVIFVQRPCAELIKESTDFLHALVLADRITPEVINLVWTCYMGNSLTIKHKIVNGPEVKNAVLEIIAFLAEFAPYPVMEQFFKLFKTVSISDYTKDTVKFISLYLENIDKNVEKRKVEAAKVCASINRENATRQKQGKPTINPPKELLEENYELYDYDLLWIVMTAKPEQQIDTAVRAAAMDFLIKFFVKKSQLIENYLLNAVILITSNAGSVLFVMDFFKNTVLANRSKKPLYEVLKIINEEYGLFEAVFKNLKNYKYEVSGLLGMDNEMKKDAIGHKFHPLHSHWEYVKAHFDFLEFLIEYSNGQIDFSQEQLAQLWAYFVLTAVAPEESDLFYTYLMKHREMSNNKRIYTFITDKNCPMLFLDYFSIPGNFQPKSASVTGYYCYKEFFIRFNTLKKVIKVDKGRLIVLNFPVEGLDMLWKLAFNSLHTSVKEDATVFLIEIHVSLWKEKKTPLPKVTQNFVSSALGQIPKTPDLSRVDDLLRILMNYITQFEDFSYSKINKNEYKDGSYVVRRCTVKRNDGSILKELYIKIKEDMTIYDLKEAISYYLKKPRSMFKVYFGVKKQLLDSQYDSLYIKEARVDFVVEEVKLLVPPEQLPSATLANFEVARFKLISYMALDNRIVFTSEALGLSNKIWRLLKEFPLNHALVERLVQMDFEVKPSNAVEGWYGYLGLSGEDINQLLYVFYMLRRIIFNQKVSYPIPLDYFANFVQKRGLEFMVYHHSLFCVTFSPTFSHMRILKYLHQLIARFLQQTTLSEELKPELQFHELITNTINFVSLFLTPAKIQIPSEMTQLAHKTVKAGMNMLHQIGTGLQQDAFLIYDKNSLYFELLRKEIVFYKNEDKRLVKYMAHTIYKHINTVDGLYSKYMMNTLLYKMMENYEQISSLGVEYFELMRKAIDMSPEDIINVKELNDRHLLDKLANIVCRFEECPKINIVGIMKVMEILYLKFKAKVEENFTRKEEVFATLLFFVFPFESTLSEKQEKVFKEIEADPALLKSSLALLKAFCIDNYEYVQRMALKFSKFLQREQKWRTSKSTDWSLCIQETKEVASCKFIGLENPANVCYMNSLLQQFFMNPMFCKGVIEAPSAATKGNLLYQLQIIFGSLKEKATGTYNATHLCQIIKDFNGKPLSIKEQRDVDEFLNLFLDRLEPFLKAAGKADLLQETFGGLFANEIICMECPHRSEKIDNFLSLNLQISGKRHVEESLKGFIEEEYLVDKNKYYCERCDRKMKAKRRTTFKVLPNYLVVVLKRKKVKLNDYYEFPMDLDMEQFTEEYHAKKDIKEKTKTELSNNVESVLLNLSLPKDYYQYHLKGAILHIGNTEAGHYVSLIRDTENPAKWYEFNDSRVGEFNLSRLPEECYGGHAERPATLLVADSKHEMFTRIKNAYLLIYERKAYYNMERLQALSNEIRASQNVKEIRAKYEKARISPVDIGSAKLSEHIQKHVAENASKNKLRKTVLNMDFLQFLSHIIISYSPEIPDLPLHPEIDLQQDLTQIKGAELQNCAPVLETWKFFIHFALTVLLRVKEEPTVPLYIVLKAIKKELARNTWLSVWLMETFGQPEIINEFFVTNPVPFARFFVGSILLSTCKKLVKEKDSPLVFAFLNNIFRVLPIISTDYKLFKDVAFILTMLARTSYEIRKYMINAGMVGFSFERLFDIAGFYLASFEQIPAILTAEKKFSLGFQKVLVNFEENNKNTLIGIGKEKSLCFLLDLFSQLLTECRVPSAEAKEGLHELSPDEATYVALLHEDRLWEKMFACINTTDIGRVSASKIFVYLFSKNREVGLQLIRFLCRGVYLSDYLEIPNYAIALRDFMLAKTTYDPEKWKTFLLYFKQLMKEHLTKSYIAYNYMTDIFIELAYNSYTFYQLVQEEPDKMNYIRKWIEYNYYPAQGYVLWVNSPARKLDIKAHIDDADKKLCKEYSSLRAKILKQIESNMPCDDTAVCVFISRRRNNMLDIDYTVKKVLGESFDMKVNTEWVKGKVVDSIEEAVQLLYQPQNGRFQSKWVKIGSSSLTFKDTYTDSLAGKFYERITKYAKIAAQQKLFE